MSETSGVTMTLQRWASFR